MKSGVAQKISISLSPNWLRYAEEYQQRYKLGNRSEVIARALRALREQELIQGYRQMAEDYARNPDPLVETEFVELLEQIDRG
jgi:Arc/MetJ-type ribon-helix-helix transcriptional regulator